MKPQTLEQVVAFLGRVPLNGSEAETFVLCLNELREEHARLTKPQATASFGQMVSASVHPPA